jgi:16S rRNA (cytidine1402-2'-O)-methyltransferase
MIRQTTVEKNCLYIVPTPIGNLGDITLRALDVLRQVDVIACEDTRSAGKLLKLLGLPSKKLISYYDAKEQEKSQLIVDIIKSGETVALISEAGTPLISDPGYKLVDLCIKTGIKIIPLPGASAFLPALVGSGLPLHKFKFLGFPPNKKGLKNFLIELANSDTTSIVYISSHKLFRFVENLHGLVDKNRKICIAREVSKINEEFIRSTVEDIFNALQSNQIQLKGEFVIILEGKQKGI